MRALPSSAAATVTVWFVAQFAFVNVRVFWFPDVLEVSTVTVLVAPETVTVTLALGWVLRRMVYVAVLFSSTVSWAVDTSRLGVSSSVAVTSRSASVASSYSPPLEAWVRVTISLLPSLSFAAVTVTVRAVLQFVELNVSDARSVVMPSAAPVMDTVTSPPSGSVARRTVYVLLFSSGTVRVEAESVIAGVSSSSTVAVKSDDTFVYSLLVVVAALCVMATLSSAPPSSCWAFRVTVWGVFQFVLVNVRVFWSPGVSVSVSPTVTAVASLVAMVAVTVWVGSELRRTV